jgi:hypothetical protein
MPESAKVNRRRKDATSFMANSLVSGIAKAIVSRMRGDPHDLDHGGRLDFDLSFSYSPAALGWGPGPLRKSDLTVC